MKSRRASDNVKSAYLGRQVRSQLAAPFSKRISRSGIIGSQSKLLIVRFSPTISLVCGGPPIGTNGPSSYKSDTYMPADCLRVIGVSSRVFARQSCRSEVEALSTCSIWRLFADLQTRCISLRGSQMIDGNIWSASLRVCRIILPMILAYTIGMVILTAVSEYRNSNTSMLGVQLVVIAILAIPAHLVMLTRYDPATSMQNWTKGLWPFLWRSAVLGLVSFVPALLALFWAMGSDLGEEYAILVFLAIALPSACIVFGLLGTMLPAVVGGDDPSFAAAFGRAGQSFAYALPRLLIAFGMLSIIQLTVVILAAAALRSEGLIFPPGGGIDPVALLLFAIAAAIGAYQVVMTAVILSRSYLRSRQVGSGQTT